MSGSDKIENRNTCQISSIKRVTRKFQEISPCTVNSLYSGHCRDLEAVSSLARVRNSGSLFQSSVCNMFLPGI